MPVKTEYSAIKYLANIDISALEIVLHTGRTHQIRVHMKSIGHPVIGDSKYGINEINRKFKVKTQLLFATSLSFTFDNNSALKYLNDISIDVDKNRILAVFT